MPLEQAKQIIEKHRNINILPSPHLGGDAFLSALGLFYSLKKIGKNATLINQDYPAKYDFLIEKNSRLGKADFLIAIREEKVKLAAVSYQKTPQGLNLFLSTKAGRLEPKHIELNPIDSQAGLLITLGLHSFAAARQLLTDEPKEVLNIDNNEENEGFGEVNLVQTNVLTLSEIVFDLILALDEELFDSKTASALLAGILETTNGLHASGLNGELFLKLRRLALKAGGATQIISALSDGADTKGLSLFLYSIAKAKAVREKSLILLELTQSDFQKTKSQPAHLRFTLRKAASGLFPFESFVCLFEQNNSPLNIFGIFYSKNERRLSGLKAHLNAQQKGNALFFKSGFKSIKEASEKVLAVL